MKNDHADSSIIADEREYMEMLRRIDRYGSEKPDLNVFVNSYTNEKMTYAELKVYSDRIAEFILSISIKEKVPIVVYGHKNPMMLAVFIGCVKAGHPYCPVDVSMPEERLRDIIEISQTELLFALEFTSATAKTIISMEEVKLLAEKKTPISLDISSHYVTGDDVYYTMFTSGSTGMPKGVQITSNCLDNFAEWMESIEEKISWGYRRKYLSQSGTVFF